MIGGGGEGEGELRKKTWSDEATFAMKPSGAVSEAVAFWARPENLAGVEGSERLRNAMAAAAACAGKQHHDAVVRDAAANVARLLSQLRGTQFSAPELSLLLSKHDREIDGGLRERFRTKKLVLTQWKRLAGAAVPESAARLLHYLLSLTDVLTHVAAKRHRGSC